MTEEQIVKALECCISDRVSCKKCPLYGDGSPNCWEAIRKNALDLINRQKATIDGLINGQETLQKYIAEKDAEKKREHEIVEAYAQAARTIELYLCEFCNKKLPYDEMIADASRKASAEIERLKNENFCLGNERDALSDVMDTAVSEAIKEFAERVRSLWGKYDGYTFEGKFNDLVKEMEGGEADDSERM